MALPGAYAHASIIRRVFKASTHSFYGEAVDSNRLKTAIMLNKVVFTLVRLLEV
jgi:hypothetical protein